MRRRGCPGVRLLRSRLCGGGVVRCPVVVRRLPAPRTRGSPAMRHSVIRYGLFSERDGTIARRPVLGSFRYRRRPCAGEIW